MAGPYTPPKLADTPLPDLLTLVALQNSRRPFIQVIRELLNTPTDAIHFTWGEVIQHAQNSAADLRDRWAKSQGKDAKEQTVQPREPGSPPVVVGVLANNGYELYVNILACLLNRWTVLLISPKNSPAAIEHLLHISNSSLLLVDPSRLEFGRMVIQNVPMLTVLTLAAFDPPVTGPATSPLSSLTEAQLKKEMELPAFYIHTSGSTGHPKIVPWSHDFVLSGSRSRQRESDEGIGRPYYCMAPLIHSIGVIVYFMYPLAHGNLLTFVSSTFPKPPSAASLIHHLPFIKEGLVMLTPSILEELYSLGPEAVKKVAEGIRLIAFGGAPLDVATGNGLVAAGVPLAAGYGTTEIGIGSMYVATKKPEDWQYVRFREGYNIHLLPIDDHSNLRELIVGPGIEDCPAVINHEIPRGFATNDVWEPHPTIPHLWKHHSRKGNITVLSNGEKSDNKQIEELLLRERRILHVQVFGSGRPMNGVILQPAESTVPTSEFLAQIHPAIEHANSILPKHSKIVPELVIIATPDRQIATTDKGTVKKKETLERFEDDIEKAYYAVEEGGGGLELKFIGDVRNRGDLKKYVKDTVLTVLGEQLSDDDDLFEHGLDSLLAIRLRGAMVSLIKKTATSAQEVPRNLVYISPTINALTRYLLSRSVPAAPNLQEKRQDRIMQSIAKYSAGFSSHASGSRAVHGMNVALSGSTGSLGSSLLRLLLEKPDVEKIYLLNRKGNEIPEVRQATAFKERGLDPTILDTKRDRIVYLEVDFSRKDLGLKDKEYNEVRDNVTHLIHAAWHLNFNLILESYERVHIAGVRHLIDLALASPHAQPPRLTFISTIAAAGAYHGPTNEPSIGERSGQVLVPEAPIDDPAIAFDQGYGASKYVSERVLVNAVEAGLRATIVRVGQLSGVTTNGAWATSEHVPIMLRSSLALGIVPEDLPSVRWVPSDIAASAIVKQTFQDSTASLEYFSIENPFPTPWTVIIQALSALSPKPLRQVTLSEWLEEIVKSKPDPKEVPAMKLLDFYQGLGQQRRPSVALAWDRSVGVAPELAVGPINGELVQKYVLYQKERVGEV